MDEGVDRLAEVLDELVEVFVRERDISGSDRHLGHVVKLPVDVVVSSGFENHVDHNVIESNLLSAEINEVEDLE